MNSTYPQKNNVFIIVVISILIAILFLSGCNKNDDAPSEPAREGDTTDALNNEDNPPPPNIPDYIYSVSAETITKNTIENIISVGGNVKAKNAIAITPDTSGTLTKVLISEGEKVRAGQTVAYVDPSKAGSSFNKNPVISSISGVVASIPVSTGNNVTPQHTIANIVDPTEIEILIAVPEKYVGQITSNTHGLLTLIAFPQVQFPIQVKSYSPVLSTLSHTMSVTMELETPDTRLRNGMYGNVSLVLETKDDVFVIHRDAIIVRFIEGIAKKGVYLVQDMAAEYKIVHFSEIETGIEHNNVIEITKGLQEGDVLITQGQEALAENSAIRIFELDGEVLFTPEEQIQENLDKTQEPQNPPPGNRGRRRG